MAIHFNVLSFFSLEKSTNSALLLQDKQYCTFVSTITNKEERKLCSKCLKIAYDLRDLKFYIPENDGRNSVFGSQHALKYK